MSESILAVSELSIDYKTQGRLVKAVTGASFSLKEKSVMGLVGESGSGKSSIGLAIMKLLPKNAEARGAIQFAGTDIVSAKKSTMPAFRGTGMTMIFQEPMTSLNPVMRVSDQLGEAINIRMERSLRGKAGKRDEVFTLDGMSQARATPARSWFGLRTSTSTLQSSRTLQEVREALKKVRITDPERTAGKYPHELSGGERQRVIIAMAYLLRPKLLIADEPTTALDVTTQAQILKLMMELRDEIGTSIFFISHDLLVVGQIADSLAVMYAGEIVEIAPTETIFANPLHPYTRGLIDSIPTGYKWEGRVSSIPQSGQGEIPQLLNGCKFHSRCKFVMNRCKVDEPKLKEVENDHLVSCHLY